MLRVLELESRVNKNNESSLHVELNVSEMTIIANGHELKSKYI